MSRIRTMCSSRIVSPRRSFAKPQWISVHYPAIYDDKLMMIPSRADYHYTQAMATEQLRHLSLIDTQTNSHFHNYYNFQSSPIQDLSSDTSFSPLRLSPGSASSPQTPYESSMFSQQNMNTYYTHAHYLELQPSPSQSSPNDSSYNQNHFAIFSPSAQGYTVDSDSSSNISAPASDLSPYRNASLNINNQVVQSGMSLPIQGGGWPTSPQYSPSTVTPGITGMECAPGLALQENTYDAFNAQNSVESVGYAIGGEMRTLPTVKKQVGSQAILEASGRRRKKHGRYQCPICMSTLTAKHNLTHHINSHKGIKNFQCLDCLRPFGTPHVLKRHKPKCKGGSKRESALLVKKEGSGHCNAIWGARDKV